MNAVRTAPARRMPTPPADAPHPETCTVSERHGYPVKVDERYGGCGRGTGSRSCRRS
ncbi:hypothetical protein [Streptomyces sp. NBC_00827]|uniref:hypothetical protein n=1 Tax=Streptomyces sp. NBC_00827 TaxID=2903677 RepID=UPI0038632AAA|nr:hypothetical protein OG569_42555 [Streptomyces sp. NBC_00827]